MAASGLTTNFSLSYPLSSDSFAPDTDIQDLAQDLDTILNTQFLKTASGGTLTGDLTVSKANASFIANASSGSGSVDIRSIAGQTGIVYFKTGTSERWRLIKNATAESGSNAGSDFAINRYSDAGAFLATALEITRSSGLVTLTGDLTISKASPYLTVNATSGNAYSLMSRPAGSYAYQYFQTAGNPRWTQGANTTAESGSDAGSDFVINRYSDAGALLSTPLTITRSTGAFSITGDVSVTKSSAMLTINAAGTTTPTYFRVYRDAGQFGGLTLNTGSTARWLAGINNTAESGSDAGSDFIIRRYSDAGGSLGDALTITRSTGATTLTGNLTLTTGIDYGNSAYQKVKLGGTVIKRAQTGNYSGLEIIDGNDATNCEIRVDGSAMFKGDITIDKGTNPALVLGASGPKVMSGTGSPEGVVTAPVGSTWRDTNATTGAIKWIKASGTGSTGWKVEYGDTGERNLNAESWSNSWVSYGAGGQRIRRIGNVVNMRLELTKASATDDVAYTLPSGFRPSTVVVQLVWGTGVSDDYCAAYLTSGGTVAINRATQTSNIVYGFVQFLTADAWPTVLPGTAA